MLQESFTEIYERDLNKLKDEINLYKDEKSIWQIKEGISNSAGNLCLHLVGNLNHFIGAGIGETGYIRNRDSEFQLKDIPRDKLVADIEKTITVVKESIGKLSENDFQKFSTIDLGNRKVKIEFLLIHLLGHFNYHLGQINYHRRLLA